MSAAIMGDAAIPTGRKEEHLVLERVCAERPAVTEDHRLSGTPVIVIDLRSILGRYERRVPVPFSIRAEDERE
jgi:hypothetical protein